MRLEPHLVHEQQNSRVQQLGENLEPGHRLGRGLVGHQLLQRLLQPLASLHTLPMFCCDVQRQYCLSLLPVQGLCHLQCWQPIQVKQLQG